MLYSFEIDGGGWSEPSDLTSFAWGFGEGTHTASFKAIDQAGNASEPASYTWKVDTTAPGPPVISSPAQGATLRNSSFAVSGTAEPGGTVELFDGSSLRGKARTGSSGAWSISLKGVANGSHAYAARATDPAGSRSGSSAVRRVSVDTVAPRIRSISPANRASRVPPATNVTATFSEPMMASSVTRSAFRLYKQGSRTPISAAVSYASATRKATLNPSNNLRLGTTYKAVVTTAVKDRAGNRMAASKVWYFTVRR